MEFNFLTERKKEEEKEGKDGKSKGRKEGRKEKPFQLNEVEPKDFLFFLLFLFLNGQACSRIV